MKKAGDVYTEYDLKNIVYRKNYQLLFKKKKGIVTIIRPQNHPIQNFFRKYLHFHIPQETYLELDKYGSFVFSKVNGKRSVYQIGRELAQEFPEADKYRYTRLLMYLNQISNNDHLIEKVK